MATSTPSSNLPPQQYTPKGGKLRPSQVITTFGPGAVVDLPDDSVMIAGIDDWPPGQVISEHRLERALDVAGFRAPAIKKFGGDIPCVRFPRTLICAKCGLIGSRKKCTSCSGETYPARIIVICPSGHADEFPWDWWVHRGQACKRGGLRLINQGNTAALADLVVRCDGCNRQRSLAGALGKQAFEQHTCRGHRPWLIAAQPEQCDQKPRSVLRGASNVYFSSLLSALSIPPWSNPIQRVLDLHWQTLRFIPEAALTPVIAAVPDFAGFNISDVLRAIQERHASTTTTGSLRNDEFLAFRNPGSGVNDPDFQILSETVPDAFRTHLVRVVLAPRLREVRVLQGFTRIDPPDSEDSNQLLAPISLNPQNWLPAIEHRGEGIFIELIEDRLLAWEARPEVQRRMHNLEQAYNHWRQQRGLPSAQPLLPRSVLLHTLGHLLIRQLSLDCGYSSSSLRERVYAGAQMAGLLIYTASADSDGSLGGLVQQGRKERFGATLQALLESAQWCSSDPLCSEHNPVHTDRLTGAGCHACCLIAETSCEMSNRLLDRALVRDLAEIRGTGYFS